MARGVYNALVRGSAIRLSEDQQSAFWSKVDRSESKGCWPWLGARTPAGYGNLKINKEHQKSHRVAFLLAVAPIPEGLVVCHLCDNPSCCNPKHLVLGTVAANAADAKLKGRPQNNKHTAARGSQNGNSKLTEAEVIEIRAAYSSGREDQYQLARRFGVRQTTIGNVVNNQTWKHVS